MTPYRTIGTYFKPESLDLWQHTFQLLFGKTCLGRLVCSSQKCPISSSSHPHELLKYLEPFQTNISGIEGNTFLVVYRVRQNNCGHTSSELFISGCPTVPTSICSPCMFYCTVLHPSVFWSWNAWGLTVISPPDSLAPTLVLTYQAVRYDYLQPAALKVLGAYVSPLCVKGLTWL